ncbi:TetR/AcrR family transcriptional regulator [Nocardia cyriacigeorgica]|uniref:Transcriptional regulator BetI n=1 Tax=Nocardia cyriacigeorgica TaxID=135487 RepID=A0A4U8VZ14_9NOCA|nr:TetR/AcrR family transcriptional regulator [Nocardia cyriacigeorgica]MBF6101761.1 TetR/AcrR family transcriptional regulator [Nocardia cyriacigeorgica]MBF6345133.1 TetR/AcrR family transcriptional regulator [Nocardia cyriacigeorgica]MBF6513749.1 TetR/AcrR family transcriptional regulator [Nocardia cyriacigeorgica]TLF56695.1 TetR/AcrR family transcriptional regulator [Nocardia cyriacigeorgica]VFA98960.1 transcriptional regulator BetI [Nocardia cyriacigeorgica]
MSRVDTDTRERLLSAAERLLLESGYERVSIRAVCAAAEVNPAAVHYHFGSKQALVAALLQSRLGPLWQTSLDDLAGRAATVAECVDAVIDPLVRLADDPIGRLHIRLLARLVLGRQDIGWTARWFTLDPFADLLRQQYPALSTQEARARWMLAFDLVLGQFGSPLAEDRDLSPQAVATLRAFVTAGLCAPVVPR